MQPEPDTTSARPTAPLLATLAVGALLVAAALGPASALPLAVAGFALAAGFAALPRPANALRLALLATAGGAAARLPLYRFSSAKLVSLRLDEVALLAVGVAGLGAALASPKPLVRLPRSAVSRAAAAWVVVALAGLGLSMSEYGAGVATGALYLARWLALLAAFYVARAAGGSPAERASVAWWVVAVTASVGVVGLAQLVALPDMHDVLAAFPSLRTFPTDPHQGRLFSTWLDPNLLGAQLALVLPLAAAFALAGPREGRFAAGLATLVLSACALLTYSRGTLLGGFVGLVVVGALAAPALLAVLAGAAAMLPVLVPELTGRFASAFGGHGTGPLVTLGPISFHTEPSAYYRYQSWMTAVKVFEAHPALGVGYNALGPALERAHLVQDTSDAFGVDSTLLLILATTGVVGFALYLRLQLALLAAARRAWRGAATDDARALAAGTLGGLCALLVASAFTNALVYPPILLTAWTLAGLVAGAAE